MSLTYLWINLAIIFGPLCLTPNPRVAFYRNFRALAIAILIVSSVYVGWDIVVTAWGEWSFNQRYVSGVKIVNLPLEEILFFITVPYSCLFIYEAILTTSKKAVFKMPLEAVVTAIVMLATGSMFYSSQGYTSKALGSCAIFLLVALRVDRPLLESRQYWLWMGICLVPFLIVNTVLTALPVVQYNPSAIWGSRFITIPLEDFFYNYSMLSFYLLVYRLAKRHRHPLIVLPQGA
jgi:lycopene cyclase domain-containing protein